MDPLDTVFGKFDSKSQGRLQLTYDYEMSAILTFKEVLTAIGATCLLDVGANIGVYSIYCMDAPLLSQVHCFEPAPASHAVLRENIDLQERPSLIQAHQIAASNRSGTVPFRIVEPTSGVNALVPDDQTGDDIVLVEARPLDTLLPLEDNIIAVKIDVEGHEVQALQGMVRLLEKNVGYLQLELLHAEKLREVEAILSPLGYGEVFRLREDYLFLHRKLDAHRPAILKTISQMLTYDLRDLVHLRREKRAIARAARNLREMSGYKKDPLFLSAGANPFR